MSTTAVVDSFRSDAADADLALEYRALHTGAIAGLVLGVVSVVTLLTAPGSFQACLMACPIPLVGAFVSLRAWRQIRRNSDQYTGGRLAIAGMALSLFFLVSGVGYGGYVYATEVPEGYARISFGDMKPGKLDDRAGRSIPPEIVALEGQKVFIKGYIRPGSSPVRTNMKDFLFVRDDNQCCFGDLSKVKYYDQMQVVMQSTKRVDDSRRLLRLGGTLRIFAENVGLGPGAPVFLLEADYAK